MWCTNTSWLLEQAPSFINMWKGGSKMSDLLTVVSIWMTRLRNHQNPGAVNNYSCLDHHLFVSFFSSGFKCPQLKVMKLRERKYRRTPAEYSQGKGKLPWCRTQSLCRLFRQCLRCQSLVNQGCIWLLFYRWRQVKCSIAHTELRGRKSVIEIRRQFSPVLHCKNKKLCMVSNLFRRWEFI